MRGGDESGEDRPNEKGWVAGVAPSAARAAVRRKIDKPIQPLQHLTLRRIRVILKACRERYRGRRRLSRSGSDWYRVVNRLLRTPIHRRDAKSAEVGAREIHWKNGLGECSARLQRLDREWGGRIERTCCSLNA
jgi:hypothetical protein